MLIRTNAPNAGAGGMLIQYDKRTSYTGAEDTSTPTTIYITPAYGASGAARLTGAGVVAVTDAADTYLGALSAANVTLINDSVGGGLAVKVSQYLTSITILRGDLTTFSATLQALLTGGNVTTSGV